MPRKTGRKVARQRSQSPEEARNSNKRSFMDAVYCDCPDCFLLPRSERRCSVATRKRHRNKNRIHHQDSSKYPMDHYVLQYEAVSHTNLSFLAIYRQF